MNPYRKYKPSGIEWIGDIPEHWEVTKVKYLTDGNQQNFVDGDWIESSHIVTDGIRYITTGNIGSGYYKEQGNSYISDDTFENLNCTELFPGDLVISRLFSPVGRSCILPDLGTRVITSVDNVLIRPLEQYFKPFLNYYFNWARYNEYCDLQARGSTLNRISRTMLGSNEVLVPPFDEQQSITAYLDQKTTQIDTFITKKQKLIELLKEEKTAIINQAVTKGLDPNVKMKSSGIEWLGEIPEHWTYQPLRWTCKIFAGGTPSKDRPEYWENGTIPWLNSGEVNKRRISDSDNFITELGFNGSSAKWIESKSLLMALAGQGKTKGTVATLEFQATCNQSLAAIIPDHHKINYRYLFYFLDSKYLEIRGLVGDDSRDGLNLEIIKDFIVPKLSLNEQEKIVQYLDKKISGIDNAINRIEKEIELMREYQTALISEVVTGKVDVRSV